MQHNSKIHLLINYFVPEEQERRDEIDTALSNNIKNNKIYRIRVLIDGDHDIPKWAVHKKVIVIKSVGRLTYQQFFEHSAKHIDRGEICIIANADISFTPSITKLRRYLDDDNCVAITRHDNIDNKWRIKAGSDSQDAWCYLNPLKELEEKPDFCLGIRGCDNRIAYLLKSAYAVRNPARKIILHHCHESGIRHYGSAKVNGKILRIDLE